MTRRNPAQSNASWEEVQACFLEVKTEIVQTVSEQLPADQLDNVRVILDPHSEVRSGAANDTRKLSNWLQTNWTAVVLVVFGVLALLILRPNKYVAESVSHER